MIEIRKDEDESVILTRVNIVRNVSLFKCDGCLSINNSKKVEN